MFCPPPDLTGQLVSLHLLKSADFDDVYAAASDPLVWAGHPDTNRYQRPVFEAYFADAISSHASYRVVNRETAKVIGCTRFYEYDASRREVCIGYTFLSRDVWGAGHNRELKSLMTAYAFQFVDRILFHVGPKNIRSQKAMEKIGGRLIDHIERYKQNADGSWRSTLVYELRK